MSELKWTGERLITSVKAMHGVIEHLHRYALAKQIIKDKIVLDIASGEGYGSFLMSKDAKKVFGVDIDKESVHHASKKYSNSANLEYLCGSTSNIPLPDKSVDIVVSFETLEHHNEHDLMMLEVSRVLKTDGVLIISSPEKTIYNQRDPNNPYHIKELTIDEFKLLLKTHFKHNQFFTQRFIASSLINAEENVTESSFKMFDGDYKNVYEGLNEDDPFYNKPFFNIAISSNTEFQNTILPSASIFNGASVINNANEYFDTEKNKILNSTSFKIGNWFVKKFYFLKKR